MTVLIATFEGLWADRRVTNGAHIYRPGKKLVRGDGLVAGFCGDDAKCTKAMRAVRSGEADPEALAALCDGLVVSERGRGVERWELWNGMAVRAPVRVPFLTHGSGHIEAQAFLSGASACDAETVRRALRYVARVRSDCGDGADAMLLSP